MHFSLFLSKKVYKGILNTLPVFTRTESQTAGIYVILKRHYSLQKQFYSTLPTSAFGFEINLKVMLKRQNVFKRHDSPKNKFKFIYFFIEFSKYFKVKTGLPGFGFGFSL